MSWVSVCTCFVIIYIYLRARVKITIGQIHEIEIKINIILTCYNLQYAVASKEGAPIKPFLRTNCTLAPQARSLK